MFTDATAFNQNLSEQGGVGEEPVGWSTSVVTDMNSMFSGASAFNGAVEGFETEEVQSMASMFRGAASFNRDISGWNTYNVTTMKEMFDGASSFDQDIGGWNVSDVENMSYMFFNASSFNQDLIQWNPVRLTYCGPQFAEGATAWLAAYGGSIQSMPPLPNKMYVNCF
jgi:surface protein